MTKKLLLGLTFIFTSFLTFAQAPVNDLCADAIAISCGDSLTGSNTDATDSDEPTDLCGIFNNGTAPGVWYSFAGNGDIVTVSLCGSGFDTQLQVFSGNCNGLVCVAGNDDNFAACGAGNNSQLVFVSDASTDYLIYVNGYGANTGDFNIELTCVTPPPAPVNDECLAALPLLVNPDESCDVLNETLTIGGATTSAEANPCTGTANDDAWFTFVATATSHILEISNVQGAPTDLVHSVYSGPCDALVNIACSDPNQSLLQGLTVGDTYTVRIYSFGTTPIVTTTFDLCIRQLPPPPENDECIEATVAGVNPDSFCNISTPGNLAGATDSNLANGCPGIADDDIWFEFVALSGVQIIELLNVTGTPNDLTHGLYEGTCDALVEVNCSAADQSFNQGLTVGQTYYIRVFTAGSDPVNDVTFDLCIRNGQIDIACADGEYNNTYCYDDNSVVQNIFQGDSAFPLRLTFNSGEVEGFIDELIVLDSDGVTNLNAATPYGNNGDLTGLTFTASGNSISFLVQSDGSVSCASGSNDPIDYTVICLECTEPEVSYEIVGMCEPTATFNVEVTVTDIGSGGGVTITDNVGGAPQTATAPGIIVMGPYDPTTDIVTLSVDPGDANCMLTSEPFSFLCIVDGCYTILDAGEDVFLDCDTECVDLMANYIVEPGLDTTEYIIQGPLCDVPPLEGGTPTGLTIDDRFSEAIDLPFTFNFYDNDYTQVSVGANGQLTFNAASFDSPSGFAINPGETLPRIAGNQFPPNTIHGAFHDIDPGVTDDPTQINYFISGVAPFRIFVVNFNNIPHFGGACNDTFFTSQQILLYESLNVIDVNLINKPSCTAWNDGLATLGLQGNDLTEFSVPVDRNTGVWDAVDETWRFVPNGAQNSQSSFTWTDPAGTVVGTEQLVNVCPTGTTVYTATLTVELPDGTLDVREDDVTVEREAGCVNFDCTDNNLFESFGEGTASTEDDFAVYPFDNTGGLDEGTHAVSSTLVGLNPFWHFDLEDHTGGDTNGNMLVVNGDSDPTNAEFYRRPITLEANKDYALRFWLATVYDTTTNICSENGGLGVPSNVNYYFEDSSGVVLAMGNTGDVDNTDAPQWFAFNLEFNTGANTDVVLVMELNVFGVCGSDFAIDDIGLYSEGTPPEIEMPDDLVGCDEDEDGTATYDLTSQNDVILNGIDPADVVITFHNSEADAMTGDNLIANTTMYDNTVDPETIWVRVQRVGQDTCYSITQFNIEIGPNLDLGIVLPPLFEICSNEDFPAIDGTVTNPDVDLAQVTYEWQNAAGTVVSTDAIFVPTVAGVYTLEVFAPVCGVNVYTTELTVYDAPVLDLGMNESFCEGDDAFEIVPNITGDVTGATYLWSTGETTPTITVSATGVYTLTLTVDVCTVESTVEIEYLANPEVTLGADFKTCPDMDAMLTATVNVEGDVLYEWLDPSGNVIPNETGSSIVVQVPAGTIGDSTYTVNVLNGSCIGTDTIDISLYDVDNCIISEGISPNGDGMNDTLDLQFLNDRTGIELFQIFNRHGRAIYEENDYTNQWGGQTTDGDELPTGTYFYVIILDKEDAAYGKEATGWVYLNREE